MTTKQILNLLDPKNQNLPKISVDSSFKKYNRINLLVFEGKEKDLIKEFPCLKNEKISGKKGELKEIFCKNQSLWVHGLGKEEKMTSREIRRFFGNSQSINLARSGVKRRIFQLRHRRHIKIQMGIFFPYIFQFARISKIHRQLPRHKKTKRIG
ncbi:hypothetical protein KKA95_00405, partial [Patescibacteria group bacterium]|nr:hypothetical protein [Patescibacteria group bacterium]